MERKESSFVGPITINPFGALIFVPDNFTRKREKEREQKQKKRGWEVCFPC